jgi:hypothetical protein
VDILDVNVSSHRFECNKPDSSLESQPGDSLLRTAIQQALILVGMGCHLFEEIQTSFVICRIPAFPYTVCLNSPAISINEFTNEYCRCN